MVNEFFSKPFNAFLGSLAFALFGMYLFNQSGMVVKVVGLLSVLFFGSGACMLLWRMTRKQGAVQWPKTRKEEQSPSPCVSSVDEIIVEEQEVDDIEVLEVWARVGENLNSSFQGVVAVKSDSAEFAWGLMVSAGEFFRDGEVAEQFSNEIYDSLCRVPGVRTVGREDHEHWAIDGDCSGKSLVQTASLANDIVLDKYEKGEFD